MSENLSLSETELARCGPIAAEGEKSLHPLCPFRGSDHQRSLRVTLATGHFKCFACDAWGYLESAREQRREPLSPAGTARLGNASALPRRPPTPVSEPLPPPVPRPELAPLIARYRAALPGSPGEAYLAERRIPFDVAQRVRVGYAALGQWAHVDGTGRRVRDWNRGRLVFPPTPTRSGPAARSACGASVGGTTSACGTGPPEGDADDGLHRRDQSLAGPAA